MQIYNSADNAKTDDIIYAMAIAAPSAIAQAKKANLADVIGLTGENLIDDAIRTGQWIRANVKYKIDDFGNQNIQLPSALLRSGKGDCKSISLLYLSIMESAGYNGGFRYASYKDNRPFTHVYVYFLDNKKNIFTFDACIKDLKEVTTYKKIKDMKVNYIAGVPMVIQDKKNIQMKKIAYKPSVKELMRDDRFASIGEPEYIGKKKFFKKIGNFVKKGGNLIKTVSMAPARGPFLILVNNNFKGLARQLDEAIKKDRNKVREFWLKLGGDFSVLERAIKGGKNKKFAGIGYAGEIEFYNNIGDIYGPEDASGEGKKIDIKTITEAAGAASGIIGVVIKLLESLGIKKKKGEGDLKENTNPGEGVSPDVEPGKDFFANDPASDSAAKYAESGGKVITQDKTPGDQSTFKISPVVLGVGAAALIGVYLITKKK